MAIKLVVRTAFADYQVGDEITEKDEVKAVLHSHQQDFVIQVALPDTPQEPPKK